MSNFLISEPSQILTAIETQPPLMRDEYARAYLNQSVEWLLIFRNAGRNDGNKVWLIFTTEPFGVQMVTGTVDLGGYPELKSLPAGTTVHVQGRIQKISASTIDLAIDNLTLPKPVGSVR